MLPIRTIPRHSTPRSRLGANKGATGVYISHDTGATWTPIFTSANSNGIISSTRSDGDHAGRRTERLGCHRRQRSRQGHRSSLAGVFLSANQGATWNQVTAAPNVVAGGQTPVNLHIAIDPTNSNIVYLSGDAHETCDASPPTSLCTVQVYRLNYNAVGNSSTATSLTFEGTSANNFLDASTVHANSRSITFDQAGNLILSSDGGIYLRTNPQGNGTW